VTRKPGADSDEPEPPGGHAAERLRQFQKARGSSGPPEVPAESHDGNGNDGLRPAAGQPGCEDEGQDEEAVPPPELRRPARR
jgi:hypothetical protein